MRVGDTTASSEPDYWVTSTTSTMIRGLIYLGGFGLAGVLGVTVMPVLFLVVGVGVIVWWDLTKEEDGADKRQRDNP